MFPRQEERRATEVVAPSPKNGSVTFPAHVAVCTTCEQIGRATPKLRGSGAIEVVLWLFLLVPGLIYSIWRRSSPPLVCGACGAETLVSGNSPKGARIVQAQFPGAVVAEPKTLSITGPRGPIARFLFGAWAAITWWDLLTGIGGPTFSISFAGMAWAVVLTAVTVYSASHRTRAIAVPSELVNCDTPAKSTETERP